MLKLLFAQSSTSEHDVRTFKNAADTRLEQRILFLFLYIYINKVFDLLKIHFLRRNLGAILGTKTDAMIAQYQGDIDAINAHPC